MRAELVQGAQSVSDARCSNARCHVEAIAAVCENIGVCKRVSSIERGADGRATSDANV